MKIGNYKFEMTCVACPEQYDVFDKDGNKVAYVRLRWGSLTACYLEVTGEYLIYSTVIDGPGGCFNSEAERQYYLNRIARRIAHIYES